MFRITEITAPPAAANTATTNAATAQAVTLNAASGYNPALTGVTEQQYTQAQTLYSNQVKSYNESKALGNDPAAPDFGMALMYTVKGSPATSTLDPSYTGGQLYSQANYVSFAQQHNISYTYPGAGTVGQMAGYNANGQLANPAAEGAQSSPNTNNPNSMFMSQYGTPAPYVNGPGGSGNLSAYGINPQGPVGSYTPVQEAFRHQINAGMQTAGLDQTMQANVRANAALTYAQSPGVFNDLVRGVGQTTSTNQFGVGVLGESAGNKLNLNQTTEAFNANPFAAPVKNTPSTGGLGSAAGIAAVIAGTGGVVGGSLFKKAEKQGYTGGVNVDPLADISGSSKSNKESKAAASEMPTIPGAGSNFGNYYVPVGKLNALEIQRSVGAVNPISGEVAIFQRNKDVNTGEFRQPSLISGGGIAAAQSGRFTGNAPETPFVYAQEKGGTFAPSSKADLAKYSSQGAEAYGGVVQPLDNRTIQSTGAQLSTYPNNPNNLANYVDPYGVNRNKADMDLSKIPWTAPENSPFLQTMGSGGLTGTPAVNRLTGQTLNAENKVMGGETPTVAAPAPAPVVPAATTVTPGVVAGSQPFSLIPSVTAAEQAPGTGAGLFEPTAAAAAPQFTYTLGQKLTAAPEGTPVPGATPGLLEQAGTAYSDIQSGIRSNVPSVAAGEAALKSGTLFNPVTGPITVAGAIQGSLGNKQNVELINAVNPIAGQYKQFYENPITTPVALGAGALLGGAAGVVGKGYEIGRGALSGQAIAGTTGARTAIQGLDFVASKAPAVLGGIYGVDIAGRSTEGFTSLTPQSAQTARSILTQEAAPLAAGFAIPGKVATGVKAVAQDYAVFKQNAADPQLTLRLTTTDLATPNAKEAQYAVSSTGTKVVGLTDYAQARVVEPVYSKYFDTKLAASDAAINTVTQARLGYNDFSVGRAVDTAMTKAINVGDSKVVGKAVDVVSSAPESALKFMTEGGYRTPPETIKPIDTVTMKYDTTAKSFVVEQSVPRPITAAEAQTGRIAELAYGKQQAPLQTAVNTVRNAQVAATDYIGSSKGLRADITNAPTKIGNYLESSPTFQKVTSPIDTATGYYKQNLVRPTEEIKIINEQSELAKYFDVKTGKIVGGSGPTAPAAETAAPAASTKLTKAFGAGTEGTSMTTKTVGGRQVTGLAPEASMKSQGVIPTSESSKSASFGARTDFRGTNQGGMKQMSSGNAILSEQLPAVEGATAKVQGAPVTTGLSVGALGLTSPMSMTALDQGVSSLQSSESASSLMSAQAPMTSSGFEDYAPLSPTFKEPTPSTKLEDITGTLPMLGSIQGPTQVPDQGTSQLPEPMSDTLSGPMSTPVITPTITPTTTPTTTPYLAPSIGPFVAGTPFVPPMPSFGGAGGGGGQMRGRRKYTQTLPVGLDISFGGVASEMFGRSNAPTRQSAAKFKAPKMPKTSVTKMPTLPGMPKKRKAKR